MQNEIYLTQKFALEKDENGAIKSKIKGTAYSGAVIKEHGWIKNLIVDLSTLTIAKTKTPVLRDHSPAQVAGHAKVENTGTEVKFEGIVSRKTSFGKEILELSEDEFEWEMSLGVFEGQLVEVEDETINGIEIKNGTVLKNGIVREISIVALGADKNTNAQIFKANKGEIPVVTMTQEQWEKFACGCGGNKNTTPDELSKKFEEGSAEAEKLKSEIEAKQAEIDALKAELEKIQSTKDEEKRTEELKSAIKAKGIEFSEEKIKDAASTKEKTELLLSFISEMKQSKIDKKFSQKETLSGGAADQSKDESEALRLQANEMVTKGEAKNFLEAMQKITEVK